MINKELRNTLVTAYRCPAFDSACSEMRWNPSVGHIPRGFCGAEGRLDEVRLVMVFAEPGDPYVGDSNSGSTSAIEQTVAHTRNCFETGMDQFHRNVRFILDACWPNLGFDQQMKLTWMTESVLCSAKVEGGTVPTSSARECRNRYLERQIALLSNAKILALGGKAQRRLKGIDNIINAFSAAPPGCNQSGALPSWLEAARVFRAQLP